MPNRVPTWVGLVLSVALSCGCASSYLHVSFQGVSEPVPYFYGTGFDAVCVAYPLLDDPGVDPPLKPGPSDWALLAPFCLLDLPLSVTLDTLLLPVDVWSHQRYERAKPLRRSPTKAPGGASSSRDPEG